MRSLSESSSKAIKSLKELVHNFVSEQRYDVQALDAFLSELEDQCQLVNAKVESLDNQSVADEAYADEYEAHHYD